MRFASSALVALITVGALAAPAAASRTQPLVTCFGIAATIIGTAGDDVLIGSDGPDVIHGNGGDDRIVGAGGDDLICALGGDDRIYGGSGDDVVWAGRGSDKVRGGPGHDELRGQWGDDFLKGGPGSDLIFGNGGNDRLRGGGGDDDLNGGRENDVVWGGRGDDTLTGQADDDVVKGGAGDDACADLEAKTTFDSCETEVGGYIVNLLGPEEDLFGFEPEPGFRGFTIAHCTGIGSITASGPGAVTVLPMVPFFSSLQNGAVVVAPVAGFYTLDVRCPNGAFETVVHIRFLHRPGATTADVQPLSG